MDNMTPEHPGKFLKKFIASKDLTIKDTAKILNVGRPALSNLLNEKSSLSPRMAARFEKAFDLNSLELLDMQTKYNDFKIKKDKPNLEVRTYTPNFRKITADQIESWSGSIEARSLLGALIRRLVNTTGKELSKVDFPAYDNSQKPGWDGIIETASTTPWIPKGKSGWEFGCNKNPKSKAEDDYESRIKSVSNTERQQTTFIFVTPKSWNKKKEWEIEKKNLSEFKDVRVYDANDLEQWIEQSFQTQIWFAELLRIYDDNILSLDRCWHRWASCTKPELSKEFFTNSSEANKSKFLEWLNRNPEKPYIVAADSKDEAIAFLVCLFELISDSNSYYYDNVAVILSAEALNKLSRAHTDYIAIIGTGDAEGALEGLQKKKHIIIVRNKGSLINDPDILLDILGYEDFKQSLLSMGIDELEVDTFSRKSGKSPTVLRRLLSQIPEIRQPVWAQDLNLVKEMIPFIFVGAWDATRPDDQDVLLCFFDYKKYQRVEEIFAKIHKMEQSPLWCIGKYRGITSKLDSLFLIKDLVTIDNLDDFFIVATCVLSEEDPALDLPEDKRWAAALYNKTRNQSTALRENICETLVLLSIYGDDLFQNRLGINLKAKIDALIKGLLQPFRAKTWLSQQQDLPRYAEASPDVFLEIIEEDLKSKKPELLSLLEPVDSSILGAVCYRTGLLWSLEMLAWKPERLYKVALILCKLSQKIINDNYVNKPINSLLEIFRSWRPQTVANLNQRIKVLENIVKINPSIGWQICIDQIYTDSNISYSNQRPQWRNDASGAGNRPDNKGIYEFRRKALDIILDWDNYDEIKLSDLVRRIPAMPNSDRNRVWKLIRVWNSKETNDYKKAALREAIRNNAFTRYGYKYFDYETRRLARNEFKMLAPLDPVIENIWLFKKEWINESFDRIEELECDFSQHQVQTNKKRIEALKIIWSKKNIQGVKELLNYSEAPRIIGKHLTQGVIQYELMTDFIYQMIICEDKNLQYQIDSCISGFIYELSTLRRRYLMKELLDVFEKNKKDNSNYIIRLLKCAPFRMDTWNILKKHSSEIKKLYWSDVSPRFEDHNESELEIFIKNFIECSRPRAALMTASGHIDKIESDLLIELLQNLIVNSCEADNSFQISLYNISNVFEVLNSRTDVSKNQLATLEFMHIDSLYNSEYGIPNLEKEVEKSPFLFVQALALAFKRSDDKVDPLELVPSKLSEKSSLASASYYFLDKIKRIPGDRGDNDIDEQKLRDWILEVRELCNKYARIDIGDQMIGQLLANSPIGKDDIWPCESVRCVLEEISSNEIAIGLSIGVYNSRRTAWRVEGGKQELELADKYRNWSRQLAFDFPYVSTILEKIVSSYMHDAQYWEMDDKVHKRLGIYGRY